jgi:EAL domain-containing protein (putative c-di-GMP-specific phosphodiesterase class I)
MKRHKVKPGRLVVEITESVLVSSQAPVQQLLARLHELGVKIAIDDFGTGYSSLSYLQRMPISVVKIDRSFVVGMNKRANAAVLRAVMGIGEELGIRIVAEGVETVEQLELLKQLGCRYIQGYLFSKPVPLAEAAADLAACQLGRLQTAPSTIDRAATSR